MTAYVSSGGGAGLSAGPLPVALLRKSSLAQNIDSFQSG